jgi:uncharacterized membrane protein
MPRVELKHIALKPASRYASLPQQIHRVFFGLFLLQFLLVWTKLWLPVPWFGKAIWPEGLLLILAAATTLFSLARQLPGENVLLVGIVLASLGGAIHTLGALTAIPFGPVAYDPDRVGQLLFHTLPWAIPFIWLVLVLNSRGVARLILRPWREKPTYGFRLLALTVWLVVLLELGLEPFATVVKGYWSWKPTRLPTDWYGTPWVNFLGWLLSATLVMAFATPGLIRKKPGKLVSFYHPLVLWLLLNMLFVTGAAVHQLWTAVAVNLGAGIIVTLLVILSGRRLKGT